MTHPQSGKRWFLADPSLVNSSGHCARYLLSVAAALRARGDTVHIMGNHLLRNDDSDLADCEPLFTLRCEEAPFIPNVDPTSPSGIERLRQRRTELLCDDLDRFAEKHHIGRSDVLLINSLRHWSIEGVVEWLERLGAARAPTVVLILHYTPHPQLGVPDPAARAYEEAFRRIDESSLGSRILLCTDSERLRAEYRAICDVPITVLPVPHCNEPASGPRADKISLSIVFAGEARSDKGFHLLPAAIREIFASSPKADVIFNIQAYRGNGYDQETTWLMLPADDRVRIHPDPLSEPEYEAFIENADLILIPYLSGPYRAQTSGIYCEAAALGIPVVVPSGTWMADQVAKHGGGVLFEPGDASSLANACLKAIDSYASLRETAIRAAPSWRAFHNGPNFIARIETLIQRLPTSLEA